jgi:broad specificity phosphatase PhoE
MSMHKRTMDKDREKKLWQSKWNCATAEERKAETGLRDAELSPAGQDQVKAMCKVLPAGMKAAPAIYCSPLRRAIQTATAISAELKLNIEIHPCLREIRRDIGDVGSAKTDLATLFPALSFGTLSDNWWEESRDAGCSCQLRMECDNCAASHKKQALQLLAKAPANTIIVSHSDLFIALFAWDAENTEIRSVELTN